MSSEAALTQAHVVLVRPEGPINVGSVARLVKNFAAASLRLVAPVADIAGREARMFAGQAQDVLATAQVFRTLPEALCDVGLVIGTSSKLRGVRQHRALDAAYARALSPRSGERPVALVFGNEADGLSREEASVCQRLVRIPTSGAYDSLNLSHAVAIALALFAAPQPAVEAGAQKGRRATPASEAFRAQLERDWLDGLEQAGYFHRNTRESFAPRIAELLARLSPSDEDARLLASMWRVVAARTRDPEPH